MSTTLAVPAGLVADVRTGLFCEWGFAAEDLANLALAFEARGPVKVFEESLKAFDAARSLLDTVGWRTQSVEQAVEIDLGLHPLVVLKALRTAQDALADRLGEISGTAVPAEVQYAMILRADALGDFAATVDAQVRERRDGGGRCSCTPTYQANVWDRKAQRRMRKTFATRSAAKQWRHDAIAALRRGELSAERGPLLSVAVDQWLADLRNGHITNRSGDPYKPSAIRDYERNLRLRALPVLGHLRLCEVATKDVQKLMDDLVRKGLAPATIDAALTPLRALYRRAVARGEARINPTVGIEKPAVRYADRRVVPPDQAEAMIVALAASERALWATALYAGLRRGELIGLRAEDIDLGVGVIRVERGWDMVEGEIPPKTRQGRRRVPIAAVLRDHLDQHLLTIDRDGPLFGAPNWIARTNDRARERWRDRDLPVLTLHEARHTYASFGIAAGLNAKTLSVYMGHTNIGITLNLYGHLFPGSESEAAGLLDAYFARQVGGSTVAPTVAHPEEVKA